RRAPPRELGSRKRPFRGTVAHVRRRRCGGAGGRRGSARRRRRGGGGGRRHSERRGEWPRWIRRTAGHHSGGDGQRFRETGGHTGGCRSCHGCYPATQASTTGHGVAERTPFSQRVDGRRGRGSDGGNAG